VIRTHNYVKRGSDCCLMSNEQLFSYIMMRTSNMRWDKVYFVLDKQTELEVFSASSLKQQRVDMRRRSTRTHYPDSHSTSLCSWSLMLHAYFNEKAANTRSWNEHTIYRTLNHYITDAVQITSFNIYWIKPATFFFTIYCANP
jgi:hypothetical protein